MTKLLSPSSKHVLDDTQILSGPFWGELRVFLAVAKAKSFNRAADALNMSQPTVSRAVRRLQDVMGAQLVIPTQAGITLTRQGEELARSLRDLDQKLFEISNDLTAEARNAEGTIRLVVGEVLAGLFVAPALMAFNDIYPKIRLELCTPRDRVNQRANDGDLEVTAVPPNQPDLVTRSLGFLHMLPVATQGYIRRYGVPTRSNLSAHCFLQCDYYSTIGGVWKPWLDLASQGVTTHSCDNLLTYALMVKNGLGIGLVATCAMAEPTAVPLDLDVHIRAPLYVMAANARYSTKAVQIVFEWLSEIFGPAVPWFSPELRLEHLPRDAFSPTLAQLMGGPTRNP